jgi:hypothetical protein
MDTVTPDSNVNELDQAIKTMTFIAEKCGGVTQYDEEGKVYLYTFTPYELLRFADFIVTSTLENHEELQDTKTV